MNTKTEDKLASAMAQGQAQFDSIAEMVAALNGASPDDARDRIQEDALSVQVRSGWHSPGATDGSQKPAEYEILLCTGGPAVRIIGDISEHGEPETARLEVQDWFTPWTACRPKVGADDYNSEPVLITYASCFYFGE